MANASAYSKSTYSPDDRPGYRRSPRHHRGPQGRLGRREAVLKAPKDRKRRNTIYAALQRLPTDSEVSSLGLRSAGPAPLVTQPELGCGCIEDLAARPAAVKWQIIALIFRFES